MVFKEEFLFDKVDDEGFEEEGFEEEEIVEGSEFEEDLEDEQYQLFKFICYRFVFLFVVNL